MTDSSQMLFPDPDWRECPPVEQGVDPDRLNQAMTYYAGHSGLQGADQAVVIRRGRLIWRGRDANNLHRVWSVSKVFTSTVLGLLLDDQRTTLETPAARYAPFLAMHYKTVTFRHLVTMTSGYRAEGNHDVIVGVQAGSGSTTPLVPALPPHNSPGQCFLYNNDGMHALAYALTGVAQEPIKDLFERRIAAPIGMTRWDWRVLDRWENSGIPVHGGTDNLGRGISTTALDLARLGHLFLNQGNWNGQRLISPEWVAQATSAQVPAELPALRYKSPGDETGVARGPGIYGFCWWVNGILADGSRRWPAAPASTFCASGAQNNKLYVIPDWEMVIVRLGCEGEWKGDENHFLGLVGKALSAE